MFWRCSPGFFKRVLPNRSQRKAQTFSIYVHEDDFFPHLLLRIVSRYTHLTSVLFEGEFSRAFHLFSNNQDALIDQLKLTSLNVIGLTFIFLGLSLLGPIKLALITTSRKVFTVLFSIFIFQKQITGLKIIGMTIVFFGMVSENMPKKKKELKQKDEGNENGKIHKSKEIQKEK